MCKILASIFFTPVAFGMHWFRNGTTYQISELPQCIENDID